MWDGRMRFTILHWHLLRLLLHIYKDKPSRDSGYLSSWESVFRFHWFTYTNWPIYRGGHCILDYWGHQWYILAYRSVCSGHCTSCFICRALDRDELPGRRIRGSLGAQSRRNLARWKLQLRRQELPLQTWRNFRELTVCSSMRNIGTSHSNICFMIYPKRFLLSHARMKADFRMRHGHHMNRRWYSSESIEIV